jgi:alkylation response protein AidB-like acyl-CoA dehydrogenase
VPVPRTEVPSDFGFTEDHALLRQEARRFLNERLPMAELRKLADAGVGFDRGLWKELAQLGWAGLVLPESVGGAGLGWLHLEILLEEMGRRLVPGPFLGSLLAGIAIERAGSEAQRGRLLPGVAAGDVVATVALTEPNGAFEAAHVAATAEPVDGGWALRGLKTHVVCGADAGLVVAPFREPSGGIALFAVELPAAGVATSSAVSVDPTRPTARVAFEGVRVGREARLEGDGDAAWRAMLVRGFAALAAESVGGAESVLLTTRDYAVARKQFDRQIGFFQAVKFPIVDMMCGIELARSLAVGAAAALDRAAGRGAPGPLDHQGAGAETLARMAKAQASDVFATAVRKGVQLHGGYGFTWDCDVHFYFRRALWNRAMLGDAIHHRRALAELLFAD